jgi:ABC-type branched-subunit amino acid transport system ATPase component/branched-subunit amino acid ABC-type transport system permease component
VTTFFQFAVIGIASGAVFTLLAQGVVVIHRASGVVNFSQGGFAVMAGFFFASLTQSHGWGIWPAFAIVSAGATVVGVIVYWVAMRPLRNASQLTQVFATLAVLLIMEGVAAVPWAGEVVIVYPYLSDSIIHVGGVTFNTGQVTLVAIAIGVTIVLWALTRFTLPGLAMRALSENRRATAALGWSPDVLATTSWAIGGLVGAAGGILIAPVTGVTVGNMTLFVVPVFAAALVGSFTSFPLTLLGAMVIGILQAETSQYVNVVGAQDAVPFLALVVLLTIRGRGIPLRGHVSAKFAELGTGRISWRGAVPAAAVFGVLIVTVFGANFNGALIASLSFAIILLSLVVLTGYAGQLSLAQLTFGGVGALVAGRFVENLGFTFLPAMLIGVAATVPIGVLFALPALRTRGMALAMVTLGLATAVASIVFDTTSYVGGDAGTPVGPQTLFGWNITAATHPERYAVITLFLLVVVAIIVSNVRRSRVGRRLIAVRTNERAAAALGVNVYAAKLYAFAVSAAIAALGGILLAFQFENIDYTAYGSFNSVLAGSYAVIGGIGYVGGSVQGSVLAQGGLGTWFLDLFGTSVTDYLPLIGGIGLLFMLLQNPSGLQSANLKALAAIKRRLGRGGKVAVSAPLPNVEVTRVAPALLEVCDLAVTFGGVQAVDGVNLTLRAGTISGLIGPNGAGKTSAIDAITGFVRPARGTVTLNGLDMTRWQTFRRARAGVSRSFQSLELFEGVSVRENLVTASEDRDFAAYATNLVWPGKRSYASAAIAAIREFGLEQDLEQVPSELPYGRRRLVAIARAVASEPSVLLLDEPAAGLDETEAVELARLIRRLADTWGLAILIVEHDMALVMSICDEITVIDFGREIAHGTPHEIRSNPAVIAAYLGEPEDDAVVHVRGETVAAEAAE